MGPRGLTIWENAANSSLRKLNEETARFELEKKRREVELVLEKSINDIKKDTWVKLSLKLIGKLPKMAPTSHTPPAADDSFYRKAVEKIANQILAKEESMLKTSLKMVGLSYQLKHLAKLNDMKLEIFPHDESSERETVRKVPRQDIGFFPGKKDSSLSLAAVIDKVARQYWNNQPINENPRFEKDDDPKATPRNLFDWKRITDFVSTLADEKAKFLYLQQIKRKLIDRDKSGEIWSLDKKTFSGDRDVKFLRKLEDQIAIYEKTANLKSGQASDKRSGGSALSNDFTARRKILALLMLTFHRLDLPEDLTKERVVEFFHGLIGGDKGKVSDLLRNPTAHKCDKRSINLLCDDLNFARDQLGKLGLTENVISAINEIQLLIDELRGETEEE